MRLGVVQPIAVEDDAALVAAFRGGDLGAAGRLYDRHVDAVYGLVFRLLGPEGEMDDLVQEVFTDALSSIHKLREPAALKGWLMSIAVGRVRSYIRWRRRKRWLTFCQPTSSPNKRTPRMKRPPKWCARYVRFCIASLPTSASLSSFIGWKVCLSSNRRQRVGLRSRRSRGAWHGVNPSFSPARGGVRLWRPGSKGARIMMSDEHGNRLFQAWAEAFDQIQPEFDRQGVRARVLAAQAALAQNNRRTRFTRLAVTTLAAAAAIALAARLSFPASTSFMIAGQQGEVGEWLAATSEKPLALDFSEGTRIEFRASSRGRVEAVTPEGALVTIERGSLSATVTHRKHTSWRFGAGPFEVIVVENQPRRPVGRKYRRVRAGRIA